MATHSMFFYCKCSSVSWHVKKHGCSVKSLDEAADLAYGLLYGNNLGDYDLLGRNCEHFATYCKTGVPFSMQSLWLTENTQIISSLFSLFQFQLR